MQMNYTSLWPKFIQAFTFWLENGQNKKNMLPLQREHFHFYGTLWVLNQDISIKPAVQARLTYFQT